MGHWTVQPLTNAQAKLVSSLSRDITATIRRILGLTGPAQPGWYKPSQLTTTQRERIDRETRPLIMRFAHRARRTA